MDYRKVMGSTAGQTLPYIREISSKEPAMVMESGKIANNLIKVIICWIRSTAMEFMTGEMDTNTRANGWRITDMEKAPYYLMAKYSTMDIGIAESRSTKNPA